jgi:lysophospholipase L1-like esterase
MRRPRLGMAGCVTLLCVLAMAGVVGLGMGAAAGGSPPPDPVIPSSETPAATAHAAETDSAYALVDAAGGVSTYGGAGYSGDTLGLTLAKPVVGAAADPTGGYWLVASDGGVFDFGGAPFFGSAGGIHLNKPIVAMAATPDGEGYWLVASDGGIFDYGDAGFYGSTGAITLNKPIVGMAATADGLGYWLVASDGGIFSYGDAQFQGSTGGTTLNKPIVGMATNSNGSGYWLVASDGGIFAFNATFLGSTGGITLNAPIVSMSATPDGGGYWLVGSDGGLFNFGDAQFSGSAQSPLHPPLFPADFSSPIAPVVAIISDVPGPQAAHQGQLRVAFAGDSLGLYEGQYTDQENPPYLVDNGSAAGCGLTNGDLLIPWSNPASVYTDPGACALWASQLEWLDARFHPDVTVLQVGYWEAQNRLFNGSYTTLSNPAYASYIEANLQQAVNELHADGGAVILNTTPYYNDGTPASLVNDFNAIVDNVAQANSSFVTLFNVNQLLDPGGAYSTVVDGVVARTPDGVHLTQAGVNTILDPQLNNLIQTVGQPVYNGTS